MANVVTKHSNQEATTMIHTHQTAPTQFVEASGIRFAYLLPLRRCTVHRNSPLSKIDLAGFIASLLW